MSLRSSIVSQFRRPDGLLGAAAGLVMANRPSNVRRNLWTVDLLDPQPGHHVLEIGCGPGLALKSCAAHLTGGHVLGIDHSAVMVRQASHRLREEISQGKAAVRQMGGDSISELSGPFDRIFSLNVIQFVSDIDRLFADMHALLAVGGMAATTYQPRSKNPTREQALDMAVRIEAAMRRAGFSGIATHELDLRPVPAICVTGRKGSC